MSNIRFRPVPPEPVHLALRRRDDLLKLYTHIRENYQERIDHAFDRVAQQIGFVVATALPFTLEIADERVMGAVVTDGKQLQGTLFEKEFSDLLEALKDDPVPVSPGVYRLPLFWFEALEFELRTEWMEPAHFRELRFAERAGYEIIHESHEPAHWLDPRIALTAEETVLISAIDAVYPELRLTERVGQYRRGANPLRDMPAAPG